MTKEIKLSNSDLVALVDDEDYEFLSQFSWHMKSSGYPAVSITMHSLVMAMNGKFKKEGEVIDHVNIDKMDTRKENLRITTHAMNSRNVKSRPNSSSVYKGVSKDSKSGKFNVTFMLDGKRIVMGPYDCETVAAKASDQINRHYFGDNCYLNFPNCNENIVDLELVNLKLNTHRKGVSKYFGVSYNTERNKFSFYYRDTNGIAEKYHYEDNDDYKVAIAREKFIIKHNLQMKRNFKGQEDLIFDFDISKEEKTKSTSKYSDYFGISWLKRNRKWAAYASGKYLGVFEMLKDAVAFRNKYIDDNNLINQKKNVYREKK